MHQKYYYILLFLIMTGLNVNAQTTFSAIQTNTGFQKLTNDSLVLMTPTDLRGTLQWQCSVDSVNWIDVDANIDGTTLAFKPKAIKAYRLKITEGSCDPVYGDLVRVFPENTALSTIVQAGVPVSWLISAGIPESELLPNVATAAVTDITQTIATCGGNVSSEGCSPVTSRGVCWSTGQFPVVSNSKTTDGSRVGSFTSNMTGLSAGTGYYVRAYATNAAGTSYGDEILFSTLSASATTTPSVVTSGISSIDATTATCWGNILSDGGAPVTARGMCWNTTGNPSYADNKTTDGTGVSSFTSNLTGLTGYTTYYVRAYAINSIGISYGEIKTFKTDLSSTQVLDIDDNVYDIVVIGSQTWMKQNLRTTKYNDNTPITLITDKTQWIINASVPVYCWYGNNEASYKNEYGALYKWYVVDTDKLCPVGWHVPTRDEYLNLISAYGGTNNAGSNMKETGTTHWANPNVATNASGFTAFAGGMRSEVGDFNYFNTDGYFWTASEITTPSAYCITMTHSYERVQVLDRQKDQALSVRCVKD